MTASRAFAPLLIAALLGAALQAHAATSANLLTNGDAESGTLSSWTAGGVSNPFVDNGRFNPGIGPQSGLYAFVGGTGSDGSLSQTVSLAGFSGNLLAHVSFGETGLDQGANSDAGYVSLSFLGAGNAVLGSARSPEVDSHAGWATWSGDFALPTGTTAITYTMNFTRHAGSDLDAYFDNNVLSVTAAVPEPASAALLLSGLGLLGWQGRRRQRRA